MTHAKCAVLNAKYAVPPAKYAVPNKVIPKLSPELSPMDVYKKKRLEKELKLPVELWDERLSTVAAERSLLEADLSRAKRKKVIDKMAAMYILQG